MPGKKGVHGEESTQKKRTKRIVQVASRAVGSVTLEQILAKRNQKPDFRREQREKAIKAAKEAARAAKNEKKAATKALKKQQQDLHSSDKDFYATAEFNS
ncbi:unnamed protein product [Gongylonema pulchrum]|uniref:40S ribosomal protein S6 n=1 Tax=Gongylonema pulchrum TaxID=637853 RepID=A0A183EUE2_9BILA|nr:unnamed protein product [Gongylonema pulchrum]